MGGKGGVDVEQGGDDLYKHFNLLSGSLGYGCQVNKHVHLYRRNLAQATSFKALLINCMAATIVFKNALRMRSVLKHRD